MDLGASAHQNAQRYFTDKKKTTQKFEKTAESTAKALKAAERKAQQTLKQVGLPSAETLTALRIDPRIGSCWH